MFNKTVDGIVKSLTRMVEDLEAVIDRQHMIKIEAELTASRAEQEEFRARKIQKNLEGLLG
jgi:hypothetical protein